MAFDTLLGNSKYPIKPLGDGCEFISGYAFKSEDFVEAGYPVIKIKNIQNGKVTLESSQFVTSKTITKNLSKFKLDNGDVLIAMTGQGSVGRVGRLYISDSEEPYLNQRVGKFVVDEKTLNIDYLYYIISTKAYESYLFSAGSGSGQPNLSPSIIKSVEIPYPPYEIQYRIGKVLKTLDDKIELNHQINQTLEQMAQAIFKSWFVDFDPVRAKMEGRDTGLPNHIADLFPAELVESELGLIPKGWGVSTIGDEVEVVGGGTPSTQNAEFWNDGEYHWTTPRDLSGLPDKVLLNTERKITQKGLENISSGLLPVNTVLMSSRAPVGYLVLAKIPTAINQGFIAMKCNKQLPPEYILQWTNSVMDDIKQRSSGSTFAEISKKTFKPMLIVVPTENVLVEYIKAVKNIYDQITELAQQSGNLAEIRDLLLPKLLSGEINI